ncbi:hypothetical protein ACIPZF_03635 [Pseudomonas sp. NPDC089752]|uniref:hypothetical protein n=1 Tax=Pseudomonas sp. NPDC089752 TaxID=3364472 RepID=UPI0037F1B607
MKRRIPSVLASLALSVLAPAVMAETSTRIVFATFQTGIYPSINDYLSTAESDLARACTLLNGTLVGLRTFDVKNIEGREFIMFMRECEI